MIPMVTRRDKFATSTRAAARDQADKKLQAHHEKVFRDLNIYELVWTRVAGLLLRSRAAGSILILFWDIWCHPSSKRQIHRVFYPIRGGTSLAWLLRTQMLTSGTTAAAHRALYRVLNKRSLIWNLNQGRCTCNGDDCGRSVLLTPI